MIWRMKHNLTSRKIPAKSQQLFAGQEIYLLGSRYGDISDTQTYLRFIDHFHSVLYFSYRSDFPPFRKSLFGIGYNVTSDSGWGCMMRSGQMMLSNSFLMIKLTKMWRRPKTFAYEENDSNLLVVNEGRIPKEISEITHLFYDSPELPFSIHSIVKEGTKFGKEVGAWFGPTTICNVFLNLITREKSNVCYLSKDTVIYVDEIKSMCSDEILVPVSSIQPLEKENIIIERTNRSKKEVTTYPSPDESEEEEIEGEMKENEESTKSTNKPKESSPNIEEEEEGENEEIVSEAQNPKQPSQNPDSNPPKLKKVNPPPIKTKKRFRRPLIILIPLRLGLDKINQIYLPYIQNIFKNPFTLGIVGGRPLHSLYFIGYQDTNLLFLDPHIVQKQSMNSETYFCKEVRKISFSKIDPSLALGFLIQNMEELDLFLSLAKEQLCGGAYPIFSIQEKMPKYVRKMRAKCGMNSSNNRNRNGKKKKKRKKSFEDDIEIL